MTTPEQEIKKLRMDDKIVCGPNGLHIVHIYPPGSETRFRFLISGIANNGVHMACYVEKGTAVDILRKEREMEAK